MSSSSAGKMVPSELTTDGTPVGEAVGSSSPSKVITVLITVGIAVGTLHDMAPPNTANWGPVVWKDVRFDMISCLLRRWPLVGQADPGAWDHTS